MWRRKDLMIREDRSPAAAVAEEQDEKLYVLVDDDVKESESTLLWAVRNSGGRKLCILRVHRPSEIIPILGQKHHVSSLPVHKVIAYRDIERQVTMNALEDYLNFCQKLGVFAERICIERDSIEKGILELVSQHKIEKLVMGAAPDKSYNTRMVEPLSREATYVQLHAPSSCHIWFIYRGQLIFEREPSLRTMQNTRKEHTYSSQPPSSSASRNGASGSSEIISRDQLEEIAEDDHYRPLTRALVNTVKGSKEYGDLVWFQAFQMEAIFRLNESERLYAEELRRRKEVEEELESLKSTCGKITEDLQLAECKIAALEKGSFSYVELQPTDEGKRVLDLYAETSSRRDTQKFLAELSFNEIVKATSDFDSSLRICEIGYESVYKGKLSGTDVAIKILQPDDMQFQREVEVLSKFRHPNLINLMGVCPEACALVYEYLANGSLEDCLRCKDNTPPLHWKSRINIATELCSALIFLHSREPQRLVHAALKPSCVYLDSNFSCRIGDFRSSHIIPIDGNRIIDNSNMVYSPVSVYMDPEFAATREVSPEMDVYSFGIILLKLLTGLTALRIVERVKSALMDHDMERLLDDSAEWPFGQAKQLAHLGLSCCEHTSDLKLDVWPVLEQMRRTNGNSFPSHPDEPPFYFICPILQEPMREPHVAADGFTYEEEALRAWINGGHNTSPMTNMPLEHLNLVPNLALRSAIREWQDRQREQ